MRNFKKRIAMLAAVAAMAFGGVAAQADTVSYYTSGTFVSPNPGVVATNGVAAVGTFGAETRSTLSAAGGGVTLVFDSRGTAANVFTSTALPATISLGTFTLSGNSTTATFGPLADSFTLLVTQTSPAGSGTSTASISGSVTYNSVAGTDSGLATLTFSPAVIPIFVGSVEYDYFLKPNPLTVTITGGSSDPAASTVTLKADVSVAPLPSAASMGFTLIAACGIVTAASKLRRRDVVA